MDLLVLQLLSVDQEYEQEQEARGLLSEATRAISVQVRCRGCQSQ